MHLARNLTLLFVAVVSFMGHTGSVCQDQDGGFYPNASTADRSSKWLPSAERFDASTAFAPFGSNWVLSYTPARIDSAGRAADQYRRQYFGSTSAPNSPRFANNLGSTNAPASASVSEVAQTNLA